MAHKYQYGSWNNVSVGLILGSFFSKIKIIYREIVNFEGEVIQVLIYIFPM